MTVLVFLMPKTVESNSSEDLFGKWSWYTDDIDREVRNAWQRWAAKSCVIKQNKLRIIDQEFI